MSIGVSYIFCREGHFWTIAFEGMLVRLPHTFGLQCIADLLAHPGREFHVLQLVSDVAGDEGPSCGLVQEALPLLDAKARKEYAHRLIELREEREEAESLGDQSRLDRINREFEIIKRQLAGAVGRGGRARKTGSTEERARVRVRCLIKRAVDRIGNCHPALGFHLQHFIRTGAFCKYDPDPARLVPWLFTPPWAPSGGA
jgi:hypothetical protein